MDFNLEPVKVDVNIELPTVEQDSFYNLCFIAENDDAPRTLKVSRLSDLLDTGYSRTDLAYNFCIGVFSQQAMPSVYIRAKRSDEDYIDAYKSDDNSPYYFIVLQTKDIEKLSDFNTYLVASEEIKLHFYSNKNVIKSTNSQNRYVNYFQEYQLPKGGVSSDNQDYYINKAYGGREHVRIWASAPYPVLLEKEDAYISDLNPLDITIKRVLKDATIDTDFYLPSVKPLDILMESLLEDKIVNIDGDSINPSIKPMNIMLKSLFSRKYFDEKDAYSPLVSPLNITLKRVLVTHFEDDKDVYTPSVKPLDITIKK